MTCEVKIIEDSISVGGNRITTMQLKYWRAIHSEFMTHRVFSRNASSSRAIPAAKMIEQVRTNPAGPCFWGANQPGMQAKVELEGEALLQAQYRWRCAANDAARLVEVMVLESNPHKQIVNRLLEPFQYISVVVTATEWDNFFALRCHPDAQPEIQELAEAMRSAMAASIPDILSFDQWHLPYVSQEERKTTTIEECCKISAARCARVSYLTHDNKAPDYMKDIELYDKLIVMKPMHASPIEHQATPFKFQTNADGPYDDRELMGNFYGWIQNRKLIEYNDLVS